MTARHVYPCELCRSSSLCRRLLYYCTYLPFRCYTKGNIPTYFRYVCIPIVASSLSNEDSLRHNAFMNSITPGKTAFSFLPFLSSFHLSSHLPTYLRYLVLSSPLISPHLTFKPPTLNLQPSSLPSSNPLIRPYCLHTRTRKRH